MTVDNSWKDEKLYARGAKKLDIELWRYEIRDFLKPSKQSALLIETVETILRESLNAFYEQIHLDFPGPPEKLEDTKKKIEDRLKI